MWAEAQKSTLTNYRLALLINLLVFHVKLSFQHQKENESIQLIIQIFMMILQIFGFIIREHVSRLTCNDCKTNTGMERFFGTRAITGTQKLKG